MRETSQALEAKLLYSLSELSRLNEQVASLESALSEAGSSAENSAQRISALEESLSKALEQRRVLESIVATLREQSARLSKSLADSEARVAQQGGELSTLNDDLGIVERRTKVQRYVIVALAAAAVIEAVVIAVRR